MKRINQRTIAQIMLMKKQGKTHQQIRDLTGLALSTISRHLKKVAETKPIDKSQKEKTVEPIVTKQNVWLVETPIVTNDKPEKTFSFTRDQLKAHNNKLKERAYHSAASCTIKKLDIFHRRIDKALKELRDYAEYLKKEYKLREK